MAILLCKKYKRQQNQQSRAAKYMFDRCSNLPKLYKPLHGVHCNIIKMQHRRSSLQSMCKCCNIYSTDLISPAFSEFDTCGIDDSLYRASERNFTREYEDRC